MTFNKIGDRAIGGLVQVFTLWVFLVQYVSIWFYVAACQVLSTH